jgi:hypothetical protein
MLRMSGAIPPYSLSASWRAEGHLYFLCIRVYTVSIKQNVISGLAADSKTPTEKQCVGVPTIRSEVLQRTGDYIGHDPP